MKGNLKGKRYRWNPPLYCRIRFMLSARKISGSGNPDFLRGSTLKKSRIMIETAKIGWLLVISKETAICILKLRSFLCHHKQKVCSGAFSDHTSSSSSNYAVAWLWWSSQPQPAAPSGQNGQMASIFILAAWHAGRPQFFLKSSPSSTQVFQGYHNNRLALIFDRRR